MAGPPIENGWLRMERGLITAIGRRGTPGSPAETLDLGDAIVLPGLVNAHTHLEFSRFDCPLDASGGLPSWIPQVVAARRQQRQGLLDDGDEATATAIRLGLAESAAAGVTAIGEIATTIPQGAYAGPGPAVCVFREGLGLGAAAAAAVPRQVAADLDWLERTGFAAGVSPHAPYSVAAPLGRRLVAEACRRGLPVAMHLCESREEEELLATGSGAFRRVLEDLGVWNAVQPPALLPAAAWIGLLAQARRGLVIHATHINRDPAALARLAYHRDRLAGVICPRTTRMMSGGLPPVRLLAAAGLRLAIGTDSRASNPDLSVLAECRTLADTGLSSPMESLQMATIHGAWALGREHRSGCLAVGRPADLVILRPGSTPTDPGAAAIDPSTKVEATLRVGRLIAGESGHGAIPTAGSWRSGSQSWPRHRLPPAAR